MSSKLDGRTALVTGAGRGLGRRYALHLASLGADVAILDADLHSYREFAREEEDMTAETTAKEVEVLGRRALELEADVTDAEAVNAAVREIVDRWGRVDIVVCNAGGGYGGTDANGGPVETRASEMSPETFDLVVRRNLHGTVNTCRAVAKPMKAMGYGRIVTVSSQAGRRGSPDGGYAHYGTAKAGIIMYSRYLAQELGPYNITVNCIAPGYVGTGRLMETLESSSGIDQVLARIPLRRIATPQDCANVVEFLVTDLGDYVTGTLIPIDGGSVS